MTPFPLPLEDIFLKAGVYLVYLAIGFGFGYALEIGGFAYSTKLANQFYFRDLTVLKVMFGAIIVAMVLIFAASGLGLLDYNVVYVNPTYLWPGIVGGLIMGVGFIVGGFCPGTSLVAAAVLKIDGLIFALGTIFGIFLFGETVEYFDLFYNSSYYGRVTLQDWMNLPTGVVVVLVVAMALFMFWGGEQLERIYGKRDLKKEPRSRVYGAAALFLGALFVMFIGQPTTDDKWTRLEPTKTPLITERQVYVSPAELLNTIYDPAINTVMLDVRSESDYNLYHIAGARRYDLDALLADIPQLQLEPVNTVFMVIGNSEEAATDAWKHLVAESIPNVYVLEGGINNWIGTFALNDSRLRPTATPAGPDSLQYEFFAALGAAYPSSDPELADWEHLEYTPMIKLQSKRGAGGGGCG